MKLVLNNNNKTNSSSNSHNNKDYVKFGLLMIVIATAAYIAVVLLFGFSINTMTAAEGFTPIPTSVVYYAGLQLLLLLLLIITQLEEISQVL